MNLSLSETLVAEARQLTDNLSAQVEILLTEYVERERRARDAHAAGLRRTAVAWNAFAERHGSFTDEFSRL
ncbi:type II toxin-antitoxin system CcdA family antitoxin [Luteimonas abyssi]|uniref:type II toxin-antitoxin system CcdA family antitoxin n=1 Tax=Luteimonas abyssi TaxID=1247514 RepID=UPI001EE40ACA|nr:type II toxin-antitoxin system CcdA family antitoxin [Luteimonas abyssi]